MHMMIVSYNCTVYCTVINIPQIVMLKYNSASYIRDMSSGATNSSLAISELAHPLRYINKFDLKPFGSQSITAQLNLPQLRTPT